MKYIIRLEHRLSLGILLCLLILGLSLPQVAFGVCSKANPSPVDLKTYYQPATGKTGEDLKATLNGIIKGHTRHTYKCVWEILKDADEDPNNPDNVIGLYTGRSIPKADQATNIYDPDSWTREHVWPKSHGFPRESQHAYTDGHHLRAADFSVNSDRSDNDFFDGGERDTECSLCREGEGTWEAPRDVKGDIARALFYMVVRYEGADDSNTPDLELQHSWDTDRGTPHLGNLCTILDWHLFDPVSSEERRRNEVIYQWQANRNPFIDYPKFVEAIWAEECGLVITSMETEPIAVMPDPEESGWAESAVPKTVASKARAKKRSKRALPSSGGWHNLIDKVIGRIEDPGKKVASQVKAPVKKIRAISISGDANSITTGPTVNKTTDQNLSAKPRDLSQFYNVKLSATQEMSTPGPSGELRVWIGESSYTPESQKGTVSDEVEIAALGDSAEVTPDVPEEITVVPATSICMEIHPTGSEVKFRLKPAKSGTFDVSASVLLYASDDCSGLPVPKSAANLTVQVTVDRWEWTKEHLLQLWDIFWEGVLDFWKWLVGAIFALIIFLIRGRLKRRFGFDVAGPGDED